MKAKAVSKGFTGIVDPSTKALPTITVILTPKIKPGKDEMTELSIFLIVIIPVVAGGGLLIGWTAGEEKAHKQQRAYEARKEWMEAQDALMKEVNAGTVMEYIHARSEAFRQ